MLEDIETDIEDAVRVEVKVSDDGHDVVREGLTHFFRFFWRATEFGECDGELGVAFALFAHQVEFRLHKVHLRPQLDLSLFPNGHIHAEPVQQLGLQAFLHRVDVHKRWPALQAAFQCAHEVADPSFRARCLEHSIGDPVEDTVT